jgi:hypothetical protein
VNDQTGTILESEPAQYEGPLTGETSLASRRGFQWRSHICVVASATFLQADMSI